MNDQALQHAHEFAGFILDPRRGRLHRVDGTPLELTAEQFDALVYLVQNAGKTVSRAELSRELWPEAAVEDNNLGQVMQGLRATLGDAGAELIRNLPRGGYRLVAEVRQSRPRAPATAATPAQAQPQPRSNWWGVVALVLMAVGIPVAWNWDRAEEPADSAARMVGTAVPAAYSAYVQAIALFRSEGGVGVNMSRQSRDRMMGHLEAALREDPAFPAALAWKANTQLDVLLTSPSTDADAAQSDAALAESAEAIARQGLAGDATLGIAHIVLARLAMYRGRFDDAREELRRALAANPTDPMALHHGAVLQCLLLQPATARQLAQRAIEANPRDPTLCGAGAAGHDPATTSGGQEGS